MSHEHTPDPPYLADGPEKLHFEVHGDVVPMDWIPMDWTCVESREEFLKELMESAEDQSTWGISLQGVHIDTLWKQVQEAKILEDSDTRGQN